MSRQVVNSNSIDTIGYGSRNQVLIVEFKSGVNHAFIDVPEQTFTEFRTSRQIDKYFREVIQRKFTYERINHPDIDDVLNPTGGFMANLLIPVSSSSIDSIGYGTKKKALIVKFLSGSIYVYKDVSQKVFNDFKSVSSKGQFLDQAIKGTYAYEQIDDLELVQWLDAPRLPGSFLRAPELLFSGAAAFI